MAYATSARIAKQVGPFAGFHKDREGMMKVISSTAMLFVISTQVLLQKIFFQLLQNAWDEAVELGEKYGVEMHRQPVLAPTGTIGFMMDCDTTGVEPDFSLTKVQKVGWWWQYGDCEPDRTTRALKNLGYTRQRK
jgi:ribonucleoside-diphosphate reductase alpha chain